MPKQKRLSNMKVEIPERPARRNVIVMITIPSDMFGTNQVRIKTFPDDDGQIQGWATGSIKRKSDGVRSISPHIVTGRGSRIRIKF